MSLSLKYKIDDKVELDGEIYEVNAMFDVLLRVIDLTNDESIHPNVRVAMGLVFLLGSEEEIDRHLDIHDEFEFLGKYSLEERLEILKAILNKYVDVGESKQLDRQGNPMPVVEHEESLQLMDFDHDADAIYSSFMQTYQIDLIEQRGKLHWFKFSALLNGLPEDTPIMNIISIRGWNPQDEKKKYNQRMREAQKKLALPRET